MACSAESVAKEVLTVAQRVTAPAEAGSAQLPADHVADALAAMLAMAFATPPSHERDSERAALIRSIRAGASEIPR